MSEKPKSTSHYVLEKDVFDPEDDTVPSEQIDRDIATALRSSAAWVQGEKTLPISEQIDGEWVTTHETGPKFFARRREQAEEEGPKTPIIRLLDLVAGWSDFVQRTPETIDREVTADELCALYQEAGGIWGELELGDEERAVREFVEQRVLPLLLRRSANV